MPLETAPVIPLKPKTNDCFVCGPNNKDGLQVPFFPEGEGGSRAIYSARAAHAGWPGLLHGGVLLALMDEALAWSLYFQGLYGVTARVEARFRQPVPVGTKLVVRAWTLERRRKLVDARAEVRTDSQAGSLIAEATATMYLQDLLQEGPQQPAGAGV